MAYGQQFLFEHRSLVDFQKEMNIVWLMVNKSYLKLDQWLIFKKEMSAMVVRSGTSAAGRFSLHKLCAQPGSVCSLHKLLRAILMKIAIFKKQNHVHLDIVNEMSGWRSWWKDRFSKRRITCALIFQTNFWGWSWWEDQLSNCNNFQIHHPNYSIFWDRRVHVIFSFLVFGVPGVTPSCFFPQKMTIWMS